MPLTVVIVNEDGSRLDYIVQADTPPKHLRFATLPPGYQFGDCWVPDFVPDFGRIVYERTDRVDERGFPIYR